MSIGIVVGADADAYADTATRVWGVGTVAVTNDGAGGDDVNSDVPFDCDGSSGGSWIVNGAAGYNEHSVGVACPGIALGQNLNPAIDSDHLSKNVFRYGVGDCVTVRIDTRSGWIGYQLNQNKPIPCVFPLPMQALTPLRTAAAAAAATATTAPLGVPARSRLYACISMVSGVEVELVSTSW